MKSQITFHRWRVVLLFLTLFFIVIFSACVRQHPDTHGALSIDVDNTLATFTKSVRGANSFLNSSKGVLVFPSIYKAGIGIGGEYGEGALRVGNTTVDYYSTAAASLGFQLGAQRKSLIMVFLTDESLHQFRTTDGWRAGVDGSVAIAKWGVGEDINTIDIQSPVVGFIFDNQGLMYNLTLEGAKFTRLPR